jgi:cytochrome c biogenesis protein CcmG, thiol:disulfide interchange protein DsbE
MFVPMKHSLAASPIPGALFRPMLCLALASAPLLAAAGCASIGGVGPAEAPAQGVDQPIPDLSFDEFWKRQEIRLSSRKGKVVLLDIWASWCVPCKDELPVLDELARRLRGDGVEIIAVSIDEDRNAAEQFLKSRKRWALTLAHDPAGAVPDRLQPPKMPTSYLIDRQGVLRRVNAGYQPGDEARLEAELRALAGR